MATHHIPEGFHSLTPYLIVARAAAFLEFIEHTFAAKLISCTRGPEGAVMHSAAKIGDSMMEISEARPEWPAAPVVLHLYVPDTATLYDRALKAGATSIYAPVSRFYGDLEAGVKDGWGNTWFIATHVEDVPPDEIEKRAATAGAQK
jgi:PhnB protein